MGAAGAASSLNEPVIGFLRRLKRNRRMGHADLRAETRESERIFRAFERLGSIAYNPSDARDRRDGFGLMFETRAID